MLITADVIHSFIHSFMPFLKRPFKSSTTQRHSRLQHGYCIGVSRLSAQTTAGKGLAQGPYMAARAGVEPTTLRLKAIDSTKAPPCPTEIYIYIYIYTYKLYTIYIQVYIYKYSWACETISQQLVYGHFIYDTSSTDI